MWRMLVDGQGKDGRERNERRKEPPQPPAQPPEEAMPRPDGSRIQIMGENAILRWTQRSNGTWRKPEFWPVDKDQFELLQAQLSQYQQEQEEKRLAKEEARRRRAEKLAAQPAAVAAARAAAAGAGVSAEVAAKVAQLLALREPPADALEQDSTFLISLEDGATIRWTKRPDGTWRKPEHRRAGWVGDLEQAKYVPPTVRLLEDAGISGETRASLRCLDADYDRDIPLRSPGYPNGQKAPAPAMQERRVMQADKVNDRFSESDKGSAEAKAKSKGAKAKPRPGPQRRGSKEQDEMDRKVDMELLPALTRLCVANRWQ